MCRLTRAAAAALVPALALVFVLAAAPAAQARSVQRGIFDNSWVSTPATTQHAILASMAHRLHVQALRIDLLWCKAEPVQGEQDVTYLSSIQNAVNAARALGIKVMIDIYGTPKWASDQTLWSKPPPGLPRGYDPRYPPAADHMDDWGTSVRALVTSFGGKVSWWECWNEPNIWGYLYPQVTATDSRFAARTYVALLKPFYRAVRAADPAAKVLGGVTAPIGMNDESRTSPLRFARELRALRAGRYMDAYSHHPYMPASGWPMPAPEVAPTFGDHCISLGNIRKLLSVFPGKPFYLTEYGYPTKKSTAWGYAYISERLQAAYLTRAYRFASRFKQIKALYWFLWKDIDTSDKSANAYFGLVRPNGTHKPSWYAYARLK